LAIVGASIPALLRPAAVADPLGAVKSTIKSYSIADSSLL